MELAPVGSQGIHGLPADRVTGDTAYDADQFRQDVAAIGAKAVIPSHPSRARTLPLCSLQGISSNAASTRSSTSAASADRDASNSVRSSKKQDHSYQA
jgi:hypothetical protein